MDYIAESQKLRSAFGYLRGFDRRAVGTLWQLGGLLNPEWINVAEHMSVAAVLGFRIAEDLKRQLVAEKIVPLDVAHALLTHDWAKRKESGLWKSGATAAQMIVESRVNTKEIAELFSEKVAGLSAATGDLGIATAETRPLTLVEKIVFYADCCTAGSTVTTYKERFDTLLPQFSNGGRYEKTDEYFLTTYGMSHRKKYDLIVLPIEAEFLKSSGCAIHREDFPLCLVPPVFQV